MSKSILSALKCIKKFKIDRNRSKRGQNDQKSKNILTFSIEMDLFDLLIDFFNVLVNFFD